MDIGSMFSSVSSIAKPAPGAKEKDQSSKPVVESDDPGRQDRIKGLASKIASISSGKGQA